MGNIITDTRWPHQSRWLPAWPCAGPASQPVHPGWPCHQPTRTSPHPKGPAHTIDISCFVNQLALHQGFMLVNAVPCLGNMVVKCSQVCKHTGRQRSHGRPTQSNHLLQHPRHPVVCSNGHPSRSLSQTCASESPCIPSCPYECASVLTKHEDTTTCMRTHHDGCQPIHQRTWI